MSTRGSLSGVDRESRHTLAQTQQSTRPSAGILASSAFAPAASGKNPPPPARAGHAFPPGGITFVAKNVAQPRPTFDSHTTSNDLPKKAQTYRSFEDPALSSPEPHDNSPLFLSNPSSTNTQSVLLSSPLLDDLPTPTVDNGPSDVELVESVCMPAHARVAGTGFFLHTLPADSISLYHADSRVRVVDQHSAGQTECVVSRVGLQWVLEQRTFRTQLSRLRAHTLVTLPQVDVEEKRLLLSSTVERVAELVGSLEALQREETAHAATRPTPTYLSVKQRHLTTPMRAIVVDWMVDAHTKCRAHSQALHGAVGLLDRYLNATTVSFGHERVQLVACACLSLAAKLDDVRAPGLTSYAHLTDYQWSRSDIARMEAEIQERLSYRLQSPTVLAHAQVYLALYLATRQNDIDASAGSSVGGRESVWSGRAARLRWLVEYICEALLLSVATLGYDNALLGSSVLCAALQLLPSDHAQCWTVALELFSGYAPVDLQASTRFVLEWLQHTRTHPTLARLHASRDKFARHEAHGVSNVQATERHISGCARALTEAEESMCEGLRIAGVERIVLSACRGLSAARGRVVEVVATRALRTVLPAGMSLPAEEEAEDAQREHGIEYQVLWRQLVSASELEGPIGEDGVRRVVTGPQLQASVWVDREALSSMDGGEDALRSYTQTRSKKRDRSDADDGDNNKKRKKGKDGKGRCAIM